MAIRNDPLALVVVLGTLVLGSAVFSTFLLIIACVVKTRDFMGFVLLMAVAVRPYPALVR